ncbi:MAG: dihydrofolate reductase family protein [Candidatus Limnocylindria bacterium]
MLATVPTTSAVALEPLIEAVRPSGPVRGGALPAALRDRYGGDLAVPLRVHRPTLISNFVSTIDGVTSYRTPEAAGGGEISGFFEPDRFVMGLLRALADVVLVGAGTLRADPDGAWTPRSVHPDSGRAYGALRLELGMRPDPITAVVTGSGSLDVRHPGLADPSVEVVMITTDVGAAALARQRVPSHIDVRSTGDRIEASDVLQTLAFHGAELILCEGGPHLFGQLLAAGFVDELFLTVAPQLAGRSTATPRLSLVEGTAFDVADARWGRLADLRRAGDHLFARYRLTEGKDR